MTDKTLKSLITKDEIKTDEAPVKIKEEPDDNLGTTKESQKEVKVLSEYLVSVAKQKSLLTIKKQKSDENSRHLSKKPTKKSSASEEPYTSQCLHCGKFMKTRDSLKSHEKRHFSAPKPGNKLSFVNNPIQN